MKAISFRHIVQDNDRINFIGRVRHSLKEIYQELKSYLQSNGIDVNSDVILWFVKFITDISDTDNASDMFRYPYSLNMVEFSRSTLVSIW
jgi:hypothetical protein